MIPSLLTQPDLSLSILFHFFPQNCERVCEHGAEPPFASVNSKQPTAKTNKINLWKKKQQWWGVFCEQERGGGPSDKDTGEERHHFLFSAAYLCKRGTFMS